MAGSSSSAAASTVPIAPTVANQMPNQARTLLLNADGSARPDINFFGEEYVPPYFRPIELNSGLLNVRNALFGTNPDAAGINYAIWQYMRILHSTEFSAYVTDLDPRITYLTSASLVDYAYGETVNPDDDALQFVGDPGLGAADGKLMTSWSVSIAGNVVDIKNLQSMRSTSTIVTSQGGLTELVPMTDYSDLRVRVDTNVGGSSWIVDYLGKPTIGMDPIGRATQLGSIGAAAYEELFPGREPYILFRQLWEQHTQFAYKMSGALLALIYRTNDLRVSGV